LVSSRPIYNLSLRHFVHIMYLVLACTLSQLNISQLNIPQPWKVHFSWQRFYRGLWTSNSTSPSTILHPSMNIPQTWKVHFSWQHFYRGLWTSNSTPPSTILHPSIVMVSRNPPTVNFKREHLKLMMIDFKI